MKVCNLCKEEYGITTYPEGLLSDFDLDLCPKCNSELKQIVSAFSNGRLNNWRDSVETKL